MTMENIIAAGIILAIIGAIIFYLVQQKKKGVTCVGCPHAKQCGGHCSGNCKMKKDSES